MPSIFDLFNYGTPAPVSMLKNLPIFSRNFSFDSHNDLKLSRLQNQNSMEGGVPPAGAKVTGATIRTFVCVEVLRPS